MILLMPSSFLWPSTSAFRGHFIEIQVALSQTEDRKQLRTLSGLFGRHSMKEEEEECIPDVVLGEVTGLGDAGIFRRALRPCQLYCVGA